MQILDNKIQGRVIDKLRENIKSGTKLSIISAYFTIYAFEELKKELEKIESLRLLFSEPTFVKNKKDINREFKLSGSYERGLAGDRYEIKLKNELKQSEIAKECANWIKEKVEVRAYDEEYPLPQKMYLIENNKDESACIFGSSDFTSSGLGIVPSKKLEVNTYTKNSLYTQQLLNQFELYWNDIDKVKDVKAHLLKSLEEVYKENNPEFIYFVTIYNIFKDYLNGLSEEDIVKFKTGFKESVVWNKLYNFQKDGVLGAIDKFRKEVIDEIFHLPEELKEDEQVIIDKLIKIARKLDIKDGHEKRVISKNEKLIASPEFLELWERIKYKTRYEFAIDQNKLIEIGVKNLKDLDIDRINIISKKAKIKIESEGIIQGNTQTTATQSVRKEEFPNILLELQNSTNYSRNDLAKILVESGKLGEIRKNPERFILEVSKRLNTALNEYLMTEDCIRYVKLGDSDCYVQENIFEDTIEVFDKYIVESKEKSIYSAFEYDSKIEKEFAEELEKDENVVLYTKLPSTFVIGTPLGNYNPDWAIVYKVEDSYKVYFVIETKGSLDELERKGKENYKIRCAKKHFEALNEKNCI